MSPSEKHMNVSNALFLKLFLITSQSSIDLYVYDIMC